MVGCGGTRHFVARVYDGETNRPLSGALVAVRPGGMMAASDSVGITPPTSAPSRARLDVSRDGYLPAETELAPPERRGDTVRTGIPLYPDLPRWVWGRVLTATGHNPVSGVSVGIPGSSVSTRTGADGTFLLERFPPGPRSLVARLEGFVHDSTGLMALAGETTRVRFALRDTTNEGDVEGRVFDKSSGSGIAGAEVAIAVLGLRTSSGPDGRFEFSRVAAGEQELAVSAPGYATRRLAFRVVRGWSVTVDCPLEPAPR